MKKKITHTFVCLFLALCSFAVHPQGEVETQPPAKQTFDLPLSPAQNFTPCLLGYIGPTSDPGLWNSVSETATSREHLAAWNHRGRYAFDIICLSWSSSLFLEDKHFKNIAKPQVENLLFLETKSRLDLAYANSCMVPLSAFCTANEPQKKSF